MTHRNGKRAEKERKERALSFWLSEREKISREGKGGKKGRITITITIMIKRLRGKAQW